MSLTKNISVIIPVFNEQDSVQILYNQICDNLQDLNKEIIFVNDGSTDDTKKIIMELMDTDSEVILIDFNKNYGKASALSEAFKCAQGDIIITIDGDLQDDPSEFKNLISKINEGWDLVSGWKKKRLDPLSKTIPTKLYNWATRIMSGISLHDIKGVDFGVGEGRRYSCQ